jgi:hypothetical protein
VRRLYIDFRTRRGPPRAAWIALALLAIGFLASLGASWQSYDDYSAVREVLANELLSKVPPPSLDRPVPEPPYLQSARQLASEASSTWPAMLSALERVKDDRVEINTVEVSTAGKGVRVEVRFLDYADLLKLVDDLNAGEAEVLWHLQGAQMVEGSGSARGTAVVLGRMRS